MMLRIGSTGDEVKKLQIRLAKLGYPLKGTGYFGAATDAAVSDFQKRNGLEADGRVGPMTERALYGGPVSIVPEMARPLWLTAGMRWVGTKEQPGTGDNPVILDWADDIGGDIKKDYTHDLIPWCALFANHMLWEAGLKGTGTLWALDFARWGTKLDGPAVGAFAPMQRNGGGHIAVVVGKDQYENIMCLGGNQSDAVNIKPFNPARVVSWRWPIGVAAPPKTGMASLPIVRSDGRISSNER